MFWFSDSDKKSVYLFLQGKPHLIRSFLWRNPEGDPDILKLLSRTEVFTFFEGKFFKGGLHLYGYFIYSIYFLQEKGWKRRHVQIYHGEGSQKVRISNVCYIFEKRQERIQKYSYLFKDGENN